MKNNFIKFINNPDEFSSVKFIENNNKLLNDLNKIKLKHLKTKKEKLIFEEEKII
jgi:hypothetical protein